MNAMNSSNAGAAVALVVLAWLPAALAGQGEQQIPLTLAEAEAQAVDANPALRAAQADARAAGHAATAAGAFRWPGLEARVGVMGTDDPVGVFGAKLRQERFGAADLDVARLNDPEAVEDWSAGLGARWQIGDPARWMGRDAARSDARAADAGARRTTEAVRYRARVYYFDLLRANGHMAAVAAAEQAAAATLDRVERRRSEGMATDADVFQARAAHADARARAVHAEAAVLDAGDRLAAHLGWPSGQVPVPVTTVAQVLERPVPEATATTLASVGPEFQSARSDLLASSARAEAARRRAREASWSRLPTASVFAQFGSHGSGVAEDRAAHWTAGLEISVPLFTGFGLRAATDAATERARAEEARHEARVREATREIAAAVRGVGAARQSREAAVGAADAAREAARLLRRRYEEGMATLAELLRAEAETARLDAASVEADTQLAIALATLDFALGANHDDDTREGDAS